MNQPTTLVLVPKLVLVVLVPKLQLGNPESEALASQDRKLELLGLSSQARAWELAVNSGLSLIVLLGTSGK